MGLLEFPQAGRRAYILGVEKLLEFLAMYRPQKLATLLSQAVLAAWRSMFPTDETHS
jgi:hypothetical protein